MRRLLLGAVTGAAIITLQACAAPSSYMGISLVAGAADPELQQLAYRAQAGDKQAQLELGIRFEEGRGVPVDAKRAMGLYRMAASDSGGTMWVYTPPVGNETKGRVMPINTGPRLPGLEEASRRLEVSGIRQGK